jgi:hypothetical protein
MLRHLMVVLLLGGLATAREGDYKVEPVAALTAAGVSEAARGALEPKGLRVAGGDGKPVCEVWFRKEIPTAPADVVGANYAQLGEGTFVGVIHFPAGGGDFRGQPIKAGYYTLRYGLILQDGNHLGVSPARDFFLLGPAAEDKDPSARLKPEELIKLSRAASGTGHPSVWSLVQAGGEGLPKVVKNEEGHIILETKLKTAGGELPVGLVVVGKTEG